VSKDERAASALWSGRKAAFPAVGRLSPDYYCIDGTIPRARAAAVLRQIAAVGSVRLAAPTCFHAGDGNLHPLILFDATVGDESAPGVRRRHPRSLHRGGRHDHREHGVGIEKMRGMCTQIRRRRARALLAIKAAFDRRPAQPGKGVPTLARCASSARMHVHDGQLRHPELPRF
jgi:glycolate oxidase